MDNRTHHLKFALESYARLKHPRTYVLTDEARTTLAVLAAALGQHRVAEGRTGHDEQTKRDEMAALIEKLAAAGVNILQKRPGDAPPKAGAVA